MHLYIMSVFLAIGDVLVMFSPTRDTVVEEEYVIRICDEVKIQLQYLQ